jgi:hypothetical protein
MGRPKVRINPPAVSVGLRKNPPKRVFYLLPPATVLAASISACALAA